MLSNIANFFDMIFHMMSHLISGIFGLWSTIITGSEMLFAYVELMPPVVSITIFTTIAILMIKFALQLIGELIP